MAKTVHRPIAHTTVAKEDAVMSIGSLSCPTASRAPFNRLAPALASVPVGTIPLSRPATFTETEAVGVSIEAPAAPATETATFGTAAADFTAPAPPPLLAHPAKSTRREETTTSSNQAVARSDASPFTGATVPDRATPAPQR